jgi:2-methylcitrate dehydratase
MTTVVEGIGRYTASLRYEEIPPDVIDYAKRLFLDGLACIFAGIDSAPALLVEQTTGMFGGHPQSTLVRSRGKTSAQHAALVNGVALRFPDFNDIYYGPAWAAHCSDSLAALLAVGEWRHRGGREFLEAMLVTYEVQLRFSDLPAEKNLWHRGWQHTAACAYASAAGIGRLLHLDAAQIANAVALAGARANTFSEIRRGKIAMDKALSEPLAASNSVLCAALAEAGFTACLTILEGPYGFQQAVAGGMDVSSLVPTTNVFRLPRIAIKPYPVQGMTPAMVQAALELKAMHGLQPGEIEAIRLFVPQEAVTKPSWDAKKLDPESKETADHSFHYCVAVALVAGTVTQAQFTTDWLENPAVRSLMGRISLEVRLDLTELYRTGARPAGIEINTTRGTFQHDVLFPKGDPRDPMTWDDVTQKFLTHAAPRLGAAGSRSVAQRAMQLESEADMAAFMSALIEET